MGTKGARLGLSAKGKLYTHLGRWGLYHRQDLGSINLQPATSSKGIGFWILVALGILFVLVIALAVASAAWTSSTATLAAPGYGIQRADGSWDLFRPDGSRLGVIQPGPGSLPARLLLQPQKR